jgi:DNA-binding PadR family transcriptional regulator
MAKDHWYQILLSLADRDLHGLAIRDQVLERTDGRVHLWPAMLYGALKKLEDEGWIQEVEGPSDQEARGGKPRVYAITPAGRQALAEEAGRWASYVAIAREKQVLDT